MLHTQCIVQLQAASHCQHWYQDRRKKSTEQSLRQKARLLLCLRGFCGIVGHMTGAVSHSIYMCVFSMILQLLYTFSSSSRQH